MKFSFSRYSHELIIFVFVITEFYCNYISYIIISYNSKSDVIYQMPYFLNTGDETERVTSKNSWHSHDCNYKFPFNAYAPCFLELRC
jgi:hypothetical protein